MMLAWVYFGIGTILMFPFSVVALRLIIAGSDDVPAGRDEYMLATYLGVVTALVWPVTILGGLWYLALRRWA